MTVHAGKPIRAFISYAKQDPAHALAVRNLWILLRQNGIDARLDLPEQVRRQDWPTWMHQQIDEADYILVAASSAYRRHADEGLVEGTGRGVTFEAALLRELVYRDRRRWFERILPVILPGEDVDGVPAFLSPVSGSVYRVLEFTVPGAENLLRALTGSSKYPAPPIAATVPALPSVDTGRIHHGGEWSVVLLGASPFDIALQRLRADREFRAIHRVTRAGFLRVTARNLTAATDIGALMTENPQIVHVCGQYRAENRTLILENPAEDPQVVSVDTLARRMSLSREYGAPPIRVLVFSVDDGEEFLAEFVDVAETVIGWRGTVPADCGVAFCTRFYGALAHDEQRDVRRAARLAARDVAVAHGGCESFADRLVLLSQ
ncbi:toll/interleukin-1 receptor domain-containing protein [Nocardia sp. NPDC003482]